MPKENTYYQKQIIDKSKRPIKCTQCGYQGKPNLRESPILGFLLGCPYCDAMEGYLEDVPCEIIPYTH